MPRKRRHVLTGSSIVVLTPDSTSTEPDNSETDSTNQLSKVNSDLQVRHLICHPMIGNRQNRHVLSLTNSHREIIDSDVTTDYNRSGSSDDLVDISRYPGRIPRIKSGQSTCDYLNQFSSVFTENIKDPIPKDPETRPKAYNKYISPKRAIPRTVFCSGKCKHSTESSQKSNANVNSGGRNTVTQHVTDVPEFKFPPPKEAKPDNKYKMRFMCGCLPCVIL